MIISARILGFWNTYSMIQIDWMAKNSIFCVLHSGITKLCKFHRVWFLRPNTREERWTNHLDQAGIKLTTSCSFIHFAIASRATNLFVWSTWHLLSWNFDKLCVDRWIDWLAQNFFDFPGSDYRPEEGVDGRDVERASERLGHHGRGASRETFLSDNHSLQQSTFNFNKPLSWTWFSLQLVWCPEPSWR